MPIFVVATGDNIYNIANTYGVDLNTIAYDNQLLYPYELVPGQALFVREGQRRAERSIGVSGYAYPFISEYVLRQTLPYLSELPIFSYGFTTEGMLIPPLWDDEWLIRLAEDEQVLPVLTLTPFGPEGIFNNQLISTVVNSPELSKRLIQNMLELMYQKGYKGVDIDFEFILAEDRDAFTAFVQRTADTMHENGFFVSVALAPKVSADQRGLLYEGKDYRALGEVADHLLLMTYEWGYTYGPPMAVAPLNQVRRVVEYAITEIPTSKLYLGIPNYGYDWTLPFVRGQSKARTLGSVEAVRLAIDKGVNIQFNEVAQSPFFTYMESANGLSHEVWFEDVRSIQAKFDLIKEYSLAGCGYWQIMQLFRANWLLLYQDFFIQK
ncbi:MAG: LysM peptidoglycan-binding domain-containing protein [Lachnospiraceae bacterium]|nr:LysM peptidoglycan-binding domain-containing protein [Lachnospiraceae bacterium]